MEFFWELIAIVLFTAIILSLCLMSYDYTHFHNMDEEDDKKHKLLNRFLYVSSLLSTGNSPHTAKSVELRKISIIINVLICILFFVSSRNDILMLSRMSI